MLKLVHDRSASAVPGGAAAGSSLTTTTRLERDFDPDAVQELKAAATSDLTIGGANLTARAMAAGLVDECQLFVWPMIVGGGKPALPAGIRTNLELLDEHRFDNGVIHLRYRIPT